MKCLTKLYYNPITRKKKAEAINNYELKSERQNDVEWIKHGMEDTNYPFILQGEQATTERSNQPEMLTDSNEVIMCNIL